MRRTAISTGLMVLCACGGGEKPPVVTGWTPPEVEVEEDEIPGLLADLAGGGGGLDVEDALVAQGEATVIAVLDVIEDVLYEDLDLAGRLMWIVARIGRPGIPVLAPLLSHEDPEVRRWAGDAFAHIGSPAVLPLLEILIEAGPAHRGEIAGLLGRIGDPRAVAALVDGLTVCDPDESKVWETALAAIGAPAVPALLDMLGSESASVRMRAVPPLIAIDKLGTYEQVLVLVTDPDPEVRLVAATVLAEECLGPDVHYPKVQKAMEKAVTDHDPRIRLRAVQALEYGTGTSATRALAAALSDDDPAVASAAAKILASRKDPLALEALLDALDRPEEALRVLVVRALGALADPAAIEPLILVLGHKTVCHEAWKALAAIGQPAVEPLLDVLGESTPEVRIMALRALGEIGDPSAADAMIETMLDPEGDVSFEAVDALQMLGVAVIEPMRKLVEGKNATKRMLAIQVLGGIPDPAVLEVLIPLLGSKDADVRAEAAFAIEDVLRERLVAVLPILVEAMDSKSWRVRLGVVEILGSPVFPSVPEPGITKMRYGALIDALDDGKKEVAEAALAILEKRTRLDFGDDTKKWREWYEDGMPVAKCCFPM